MSDALEAAWAHLPEYLGWHVLLSLSAMALGILVSVPVAVVSARSPAIRAPALALASIVQAIPGLALLALFYPVLLGVSAITRATFGFGFRALGFLPALAALALYSMLPVLRNTIAGLNGIDPAVRTAARAVGMSRYQELRFVELPLAAPIILAGIRTAAVWVIGTATLSTPVGQTSLGNYIFTGLQTENWIFVLFGCVAAALLALIVDRFLALAEAGLAMRSRIRLIGSAVGLAVLAGASILPVLDRGGPVPLVVGTKGFDEQLILGALIEDRLHRAGLATERRDGLGSQVIFDALAANDVDVYVDYSGTIWFDDMKRADVPARSEILRQMSDWLWHTHGIRCLGPLGFENAYAIAMRRDRARALHVRSLADIAAYAPRMKIGGDFEIFSRPEWRAVKRSYGLNFAVERQYQPEFMYRALVSGDVDVITAFSSDGRIARFDLRLLTDPRGALPPYDAVLLVAPERSRDKRLIAALTPLVGSLDLAAMQRANLMVDQDVGKRTPEQVAAILDRRVSNRARLTGRGAGP